MTDVYAIITDRIVRLLERGVVPWHKPWQSRELMPQNLVSRKPYRGVNVFLLHAMSYSSPFWLTYKQAQELGGNVKCGEKACPVVFWKWLEVEDEVSGAQERVPFLRYYSVFNVAQCEGIETSNIEGPCREHDPIAEAERIVAVMPKRPTIQHGGNRACYLPSVDRVEMPKPESFRSSQDYYNVLFHELTHSTGHESRLNRKGVSGTDGEWSAFGSTPSLRAAKARGVKLGRKPTLWQHVATVRRLQAEGRGVRSIARETGLPVSSVHKLAASIRNGA